MRLVLGLSALVAFGLSGCGEPSVATTPADVATPAVATPAPAKECAIDAGDHSFYVATGEAALPWCKSVAGKTWRDGTVTVDVSVGHVKMVSAASCIIITNPHGTLQLWGGRSRGCSLDTVPNGDNW